MAKLDNETLQVIARRRSIRAYQKDSVTQTEKDAILQATLRAPTAGNQMLYTLIEVEDQQLKDSLAETCDHQPFIATAPYVLLFCADYQRWFDYFLVCQVRERCDELKLVYREPEAGDFFLAACDALIAAQTAVIAAESLGIGSCYIGDILENYETHREMFALPRWVMPVTLVCFGRAITSEATPRQTPRFARDTVVYQNRYRQFDPDELKAMFLDREEQFQTHRASSQAANFGQHMYLRKFIADFSIEMTRSVRAMIENWEGTRQP
jgi:nitroreductase